MGAVFSSCHPNMVASGFLKKTQDGLPTKEEAPSPDRSQIGVRSEVANQSSRMRLERLANAPPPFDWMCVETSLRQLRPMRAQDNSVVGGRSRHQQEELTTTARVRRTNLALTSRKLIFFNQMKMRKKESSTSSANVGREPSVRNRFSSEVVCTGDVGGLSNSPVFSYFEISLEYEQKVRGRQATRLTDPTWPVRTNSRYERTRETVRRRRRTCPCTRPIVWHLHIKHACSFVCYFR